jgi:preprotein translocase subunit SecE
MALREFPIRLIKEVQKVRWPKQKDLGSKLAWVIGFMLSLAILFYFVDWGIQALFGVAKII